MFKARLLKGKQLEQTLNELSDDYVPLFESIAPSLFTPMLDGVNKAITRIFAIEPSEATQELFAKAAEENLAAARAIPVDMVERLRAIAKKNPGDTQALMAEFAEVEGKSLRQAKNSAIGLTRSIYQSAAVERAQSTGATEGEWIHSQGSKHPRHKHQACSGHRFDLATGKFLTGPQKGKGAGFTDSDNELVKPGEAYGCKCTFRIIPNFGE